MPAHNLGQEHAVDESGNVNHQNIVMKMFTRRNRGNHNDHAKHRLRTRLYFTAVWPPVSDRDLVAAGTVSASGCCGCSRQLVDPQADSQIPPGGDLYLSRWGNRRPSPCRAMLAGTGSLPSSTLTVSIAACGRGAYAISFTVNSPDSTSQCTVCSQSPNPLVNRAPAGTRSPDAFEGLRPPARRQFEPL